MLMKISLDSIIFIMVVKTWLITNQILCIGQLFETFFLNAFNYRK